MYLRGTADLLCAVRLQVAHTTTIRLFLDNSRNPEYICVSPNLMAGVTLDQVIEPFHVGGKALDGNKYRTRA